MNLHNYEWTYLRHSLCYQPKSAFYNNLQTI
jgi:hypothetical protein